MQHGMDMENRKGEETWRLVCKERKKMKALSIYLYQKIRTRSVSQRKTQFLESKP